MRSLRAAYVEVRQLWDSVSYTVIDSTAHFTAFHVYDANVHERATGRERKDVKTVSVHNENVRF